MASKQLILIDGSSFLYRAYYSMQPLHAPDGKPVQAVYGFCRMIKKLVDKLDPKNMVLVWDSKGPTLRHTIFTAYKATRQAPPNDLFEQKELIKRFAQLIGLAQVEQPGVEADDIIGSLAQSFSKQGYNIIVVSSDKDLLQLLGPSITIFDTFKDQEITAQNFEKSSGFSPSKVPFYHALLGDSSDNIPGVKGIGKQGALQLVQQFESLDGMYAHIDVIEKPRLKNALLADKENAFLSLQLFLLREVPVAITEQEITFDRANWSKAYPLFKELNFKSLLKSSEENSSGNPGGGSTEPLSGKKYHFSCVTDQQQLVQVIQKVRQVGIVAVDTETTGFSPFESSLVGISLCCGEGEAWYIPLAHATQKCLNQEYALPVLKELLQDASIKKVMHNAKFDLLVLNTAGINVQGLHFDTMLAASLLVPDWQKIGLKALSQSILGEQMLTYKEVVEAKKYSNFSYVPLEMAVEYAAADAHQTFKLWQLFSKQLQEQGLLSLYQNIEHPLIEVLCAMEREGILCDRNVLQDLEGKAKRELDIIEQEIYGLTGTMPGSLNLNSPKQLEQLLFGALQLPPQKKSAKKTGYSTDQEVLEILAQLHIVPKLILRHRELAKLRSTYLAGLPETISKKTQKIHTSFSQTNVVTGRLASSNPNLQNIPVQVGEITVRSAFQVPLGYQFISADYSQIELRVLAYLARDQQLIEAFCADRDVHAQTAAKLFNVTLDQVSQQQRQIGKRINFSIMYGLTPYGLSRDLNISTTDAKRYIEMFFQQYPGIKHWMDEITQKAQQQGYVTTWLGRKRFVPGIYEKNKHLFEAARRVAINTPAQGTAAEIMKLGMIRLHEALQKEKLDAIIVLQIHDELLVKVAEHDSDKVKEIIKQTLEHVVDWDVPLRINLRIGKTWQDVTK